MSSQAKFLRHVCPDEGLELALTRLAVGMLVQKEGCHTKKSKGPAPFRFLSRCPCDSFFAKKSHPVHHPGCSFGRGAAGAGKGVRRLLPGRANLDAALQETQIGLEALIQSTQHGMARFEADAAFGIFFPDKGTRCPGRPKPESHLLLPGCRRIFCLMIPGAFNVQADSKASSAALQPCSLAALQPCSLAALQPCSLAALQPCSLAALQPCICFAMP